MGGENAAVKVKEISQGPEHKCLTVELLVFSVQLNSIKSIQKNKFHGTYRRQSGSFVNIINVTLNDLIQIKNVIMCKPVYHFVYFSIKLNHISVGHE